MGFWRPAAGRICLNGRDITHALPETRRGARILLKQAVRQHGTTVVHITHERGIGPHPQTFQRAVFIAALNAVLRSVGSISRTIHCKDQEPETCARNLVDFVKEAYGSPRIAFVGLQPAMLDHLARHYRIRVSDMDPANQGRVKYGLAIEPVEKTPEMLEWADVVFATGSVLVNDSWSTTPTAP